MSTNNKGLTPSQGGSQIAVRTTLPEIEQGLSCRTMEEALAAPTLAMAKRVVGEEKVLFLVGGAVLRGMEYFGDGQKLSPAQSTLFAEALIEKYPHESLADVALFMRRAAFGEYGEENHNGEIVKRGQTYGQLTIPKLMGWWRQYMNEKIEAQERQEAERKGAHRQAMDMHPKILQMWKDEAAKAKEKRVEDGKAARLHRLREALPKMDTADLVNAYDTNHAADERSLIIQEAERRELTAEMIEQARTRVSDRKGATEGSGPQDGTPEERDPVGGTPKEGSLPERSSVPSQGVQLAAKETVK